jgi:hypothetical protein
MKVNEMIYDLKVSWQQYTTKSSLVVSRVNVVLMSNVSETVSYSIIMDDVMNGILSIIQLYIQEVE